MKIEKNPVFVKALSDAGGTQASLEALFATHPAQESVFMASDGLAFFCEGAAGSHSQRLACTDFIEVSRGENLFGEAGEKALTGGVATENTLAEAFATAETERTPFQNSLITKATQSIKGDKN
ncbi:hypothetical protein SNE26_20380 [Mucilaginibacter sp. cycad4]|uniref:hypothetical protein n=1 Tax=Mucilaginibacter sp. cycad4 TaxID=3342096 RepID=UPI002AAC4980|nr:hypothetical protein [Mucilaginibacter gossypii]WPU98386.1 hypothetical protein SNE26_20380 [Mucilaginibacter gossypii]